MPPRATAVSVAIAIVAVVGAWYVARGGGDEARARTADHAAPVPEAMPAAPAAASERTSAREPVAPPAEPTAPKAADEQPKSVRDLPEDLRAKVEQAIAHCRFSCECLGIPLPRQQPRLTLADAKQIVEAEARLQAEILASALAEQDLLHARLEANPSFGLLVPESANHELDALMRKAFPGWPDGYRFAEVSDGETRRIGAWKVAGDEVLEYLTRNHDFLAVDHARAVRAGYRRNLTF